MGTVEVETSESVNHLEARAQWAHLGRARAPFHLYVPAGSVDIARRLAAENGVNVSEIWSYHTIGDQTRFTLVHRSANDSKRSEPRRVAEPARAAGGSAPKPRTVVKKRTAPAPRRKAAPGRGGRAAASPRKATRTASTQKRK
jgi:hypothetical protein